MSEQDSTGNNPTGEGTMRNSSANSDSLAPHYEAQFTSEIMRPPSKYRLRQGKSGEGQKTNFDANKPLPPGSSIEAVEARMAVVLRELAEEADIEKQGLNLDQLKQIAKERVKRELTGRDVSSTPMEQMQDISRDVEPGLPTRGYAQNAIEALEDLHRTKSTGDNNNQ